MQLCVSENQEACSDLASDMLLKINALCAPYIDLNVLAVRCLKVVLLLKPRERHPVGNRQFVPLTV